MTEFSRHASHAHGVSTVPTPTDAAVGAPLQHSLARDQRAAGIELLRILSCIGIVFFHVGGPLATIGYSGLPIFMMISVALAVHRPLTGTSGDQHVVLTRALRFGLPWLFWSTIYGIALTIRAEYEGRPLFELFLPWMILTGPRLHLWYLPFAMVTTAALAVLARYGLIARTPRAATLFAAIGALAILICAAAITRVQAPPLAQWLFVAPAIPLGLILAARRPFASPDWSGLSRLTIGGLAGGTVALFLGWNDLAIPFMIASVATPLLWTLQRPAPRWIRQLSNLTLGVYLIHPMVHTIIERSKFALTETPMALLVAAVSAATIALMHRSCLRTFI